MIMQTMKTFQTLAIIDRAIRDGIKARELYDKLFSIWGDDFRKFFDESMGKTFKDFIQQYGATRDNLTKQYAENLYNEMKNINNRI